MTTKDQVKAKMLMMFNKLEISSPQAPNEKLVDAIFEVCLGKFLRETTTRYNDSMRILVGLEKIEEMFVKANDSLGVKRGKNGRIKR